MATFLFEEIVFGPVNSRRLGISLGVNLLPVDGKICSFDCVYCECGYNKDRRPTSGMPGKEEVIQALEQVLSQRAQAGLALDHITFAGNGEPTLHPQFSSIITATIQLRDQYFPQAQVAVLSNATRIHKPEIIESLLMVDNNILKLDSAIPETVTLLNQPQASFDHSKFYADMKVFAGQFILQTMFLRGELQGVKVDNTSTDELAAYLKILPLLQPRRVQIYSIARDTPQAGLEAVSKEELQAIAQEISDLGIPVDIA